MQLTLPRWVRFAIVASAVPAAVGVLGWGGREACRRSEFFRVRQVEITGVRYLSTRAVVEALGLRDASSICDGLGEAEQAVIAMPGVADAEVGRRIPGSVWVQVREIVPVAFVDASDGLVVVDRHGARLPFDPSVARIDLPVVVGSSRGTLELLGRLGTLDPGFVDRVSDVRSRADGIVLELDSLDVVMGPNAGSGTLRAIQAVADDLESRGRSAAQFDARFAGLIVVQPRSGS